MVGGEEGGGSCRRLSKTEIRFNVRRGNHNKLIFLLPQAQNYGEEASALSATHMHTCAGGLRHRVCIKPPISLHRRETSACLCITSA